MFVELIFKPLEHWNPGIAARNVLGGGLTLGLLTLPVVIVAAQEAIRAVPPSIRQGAYAVVGLVLMMLISRFDYSRLRDLRLGDSAVDLRVSRHGDDVALEHAVARNSPSAMRRMFRLSPASGRWASTSTSTSSSPPNVSRTLSSNAGWRPSRR